MKNVKKILTLSIAVGALGALTLGAASRTNTVKTEAATNLGAVKYLAVNDTNFYKENNNLGKGGTGVGELTSGRRDTFHDGRRSYNALDNFINTMAKTGEGETGWIRSNEWVHTGGYVSFLLGGNHSCFVNVWAEPEGVKDQPGYLPGANVVDHAQNDFYSSRGDAFDGKYTGGEEGGAAFELSGNMALKYYHISDDYIGRRLIVYIEDNATSYYGGVTFGDLRVNQTLAEVVRTFSVHKQQIRLDAELSTQNSWSADYMLNTYYTGSYYDTLNNAAALDNADEGFEQYGLTNWAYDGAFSTVDINFAGAVSNDDAKARFNERMPANKTDNYYFNADSSVDLYGDGEAQKYRLISNEFTLSGTGFVSAKIGGGTAVVSVIDSTGAELATTRCAAAEGTNILNPAFLDVTDGVGNIMTSGARYNTMTRVYLDLSAHLTKKVRVVLSDERTGGNWGLAYFDEIVTKYDSLPTLKVDRIQQQYGENPTYYGVVTDKYYGSLLTTFGQAYNFVQSYYSTMRQNGKGVSWCSVKTNDEFRTEVSALADTYDALDDDVKALVNAAQDYDFGSAATSENWWLAGAANLTTVGTSMAAAKALIGGGSPSFNGLMDLNNSYNANFGIIIVSLIVVASLAFLFLVAKKRKENN